MKLTIVNETHLDVDVKKLEELIVETIRELDEFGIKYGGIKFVLRIYSSQARGAYSYERSEIVLFLGSFYLLKKYKDEDRLREKCFEAVHKGKKPNKVVKELVRKIREYSRDIRVLESAERCVYYLESKGKDFGKFLKAKNKKSWIEKNVEPSQQDLFYSYITNYDRLKKIIKSIKDREILKFIKETITHEIVHEFYCEQNKNIEKRYLEILRKYTGKIKPGEKKPEVIEKETYKAYSNILRKKGNIKEVDEFLKLEKFVLKHEIIALMLANYLGKKQKPEYMGGKIFVEFYSRIKDRHLENFREFFLIKTYLQGKMSKILEKRFIRDKAEPEPSEYPQLAKDLDFITKAMEIEEKNYRKLWKEITRKVVAAVKKNPKAIGKMLKFR